jgi:hypothetical protein
MSDMLATLALVGGALWWLGRKFTAPPACAQCAAVPAKRRQLVGVGQLRLGKSSAARAAAAAASAEPPSN